MTRFSLLLLSLFFAASAIAQAKQNLNQKGVAVEGYDVVAYVKSNQAVKGKAQWAVSYQDAVYHFSNEANKETFKKNPAAYVPQYGGWCAYAMGKYGGLVEIDPETFKVVDGKLYLFYNKTFNNTLPLWNKDESNLKSTADKTWVNKYKGKI
jgi:YHS domain-containing protein